ncbi:MAG: nucleotide exchange factor GrpE [Coriobacteriales bacterium]|jgi:molecular chaperone GrpE|nr:nucleotide exchange factor GrpE [Coriobacteriales bacterium]
MADTQAEHTQDKTIDRHDEAALGQSRGNSQKADSQTPEAAAAKADPAKPKHRNKSAKLEKELEHTQQDLLGAQAETAAYKDKLARLQAEWDNFRKRTAQERSAERQRATESLITDLLPCLDDMERALAAANAADGLQAGVQAVYNKLGEALAKHGLSAIDPLGQAFDAKEHNAVAKVASAQDEDIICEVYQKGYKIADKLIRPAMVAVSAGKASNGKD